MERGPYTFGMSTEDDLRRLGQAAAALAGVAAGRAKQVAEQLLGPRDRGREDAKRRSSSFVEDGKHAAADVVGALRREASVILHDLEHLEQTLRAREGGGPSAATTAETALAPAKQAPAKRSGAAAGGGTSTAKATKTTSAHKPAAAGTAKENPEKRSAPRAKATGARKAAGPRKATGGSGRPSSEGQG
jgi:heparin binding hemagglutinin HbhA